ncbi:MAG: hypothetical protein ACP5D7_11990 [Limnospira sp.]
MKRQLLAAIFVTSLVASAIGFSAQPAEARGGARMVARSIQYGSREDSPRTFFMILGGLGVVKIIFDMVESSKK